jgi:hypothetical protein
VPREGVRISLSQLSKALRKQVPLAAPTHTLKRRPAKETLFGETTENE